MENCFWHSWNFINANFSVRILTTCDGTLHRHFCNWILPSNKFTSEQWNGGGVASYTKGSWLESSFDYL